MAAWSSYFSLHHKNVRKYLKEFFRKTFLPRHFGEICHFVYPPHTHTRNDRSTIRMNLVILRSFEGIGQNLSQSAFSADARIKEMKKRKIDKTNE